MATTTPRVVVVTRPSAYESLLAAHGTHGQAAFFLRTRGQQVEPVRAAHELVQAARAEVLDAVPGAWRRADITRADLDRFLFGPDDIVVAVGPDGLVANVAKYLDGQPVVGINPDPATVAGVLVRHAAGAAPGLLARAAAGDLPLERRAMVEATTTDGRSLRALNELFVGHRSHQSARYDLQVAGAREHQSSSGIVVATGTGATGWARSIHGERPATFALPPADAHELAWFVREAWPSPTTGATLSSGLLPDGRDLVVTSRMDDGGVAFGDGIEADRLALGWGEQLTLRRSARELLLA